MPVTPAGGPGVPDYIPPTAGGPEGTPAPGFQGTPSIKDLETPIQQ